jgi:6-phosphofructokinase 1
MVKIEEVAAKTKTMPDEFIAPEGNMVTKEFKNYARPLIGDLAVMDRIAAPGVYKIKNA